MPSLRPVLSKILLLVSGSGFVSCAAAQIDPPGEYQTIVKEDWSRYPDKNALQGQFGVEGGLHQCTAPDGQGGTKCDPHLPVTDFYDLVSDPIFGKVVRYNGGPHLNTKAKNMPGRVALHGVQLGGEYPHVWVRQYVRFSPNFMTTSRTGGQGGPSYKVMFLRFKGSSARHQFVLDGPRGVQHGGGSPGLTRIGEGTLPAHNVKGMNVQYRTSGWPFPDAYPMIKVPGPSPAAPRGAPFGDGDGEWYEVILHHKTGEGRGEFTMFWRRYTSGGAISPGHWKIDARYIVVQGGQRFPGVTVYTMGINRNRQYDEEMFVYWGPHEVVDGTRHPNPWGMPVY
jgi:hypothetical protein